MEEKQLTVTAVITTYKREWQWIERAVQSALNQTYPVLEVLIVDDNTAPSPYSDSVRAAAAGMDRVRYIPMVKNGGVSAARNKGIENARGDLIGFLDDDDEWLPDKIEKQAALFAQEPGLGLAFGIGRKIEDDTGKEGLTWNHQIFKERPTFEDELRQDHVGSTSHPLMRLDAVKAVGGFRTENQPAVEDYELWIRIARKYPIRGIDEPIYIKHMVAGEHISLNRARTFAGFKNIYFINREEYRRLPAARCQILRNISREGVKAKKPEVIPYLLRWFFLNLRLKLFKAR